uniref:interleukin 12 receptor, beta 2a, like isoform X1 n=1 Tax=Monopterus albus TaxID=43700 RepID=UPI0009B40D1D|nr:interleukin-6 receptor subunit beta-like isoform X1 [Monopterus albus]XP_020472021.1 interleukin-6 receptor subunit beta-like isoform X1 [Monopterus albus]XP_020472022.1 interleukin-6 receptor subunit beta-like isoform X1 [Monopterus albus]
MATLRTRCLLSFLLVHLKNCSPTAGPPAPPSAPECFIPCNEENLLYINCSWNASPDLQGASYYSLHWEPENRTEKHVINGTNLSEVIHREHFTYHENFIVWVEATNQHGSAKSQTVKFYPQDNIKSCPPKVTVSQQESIEIDWSLDCGNNQLSAGPCQLRHRTDADQVWQEHDSGNANSYTMDSPQPCTLYEFQVRCTCETILKSDWSEIHRTHYGETAPIGKLDIWRDCGISLTSTDCVLIWKKLPISQACGLIQVYEVRLSYNNGTAKLVNVSVDEPSSQLVCDEMQCYLNSSLKDVSSVTASAYNAHGATVPTYVAMPGKDKNKHAFDITMNEENLTVSWDLPSLLSDNLDEYVVQYKQAECLLPGQGFDWVKVNKSQTSVFFKGPFKKYTPYQVSLFTVSHSRIVHQKSRVSSVFGYSAEGTPSKVPSFKVLSIAATHVILVWEPVPFFQQNGVIRYYQIGVDGQNVYNVSASPHQENMTFELKHLSPGQEYEAWIKAVTKAGPGANTTTRFKTEQDQSYVHSIPWITGVVAFVLLITCSSCVLFSQGKNKEYPSQCFYDKVPDPRNSHIIKQVRRQFNEPCTCISISICEPHPKISQLEVVEIQPGGFKSSMKEISDPDGLTRPMNGDWCLQMDDPRKDVVTEECDRTDQKYGREEYSKMIDSDEERDKGDEGDGGSSWNSAEEEEFTLGYEKHFMPTAMEVLEF